MANTSNNDYNNFIQLLRNSESFKVYNIDDNVKTIRTNIKLIAIVYEIESNKYELKFINKKRGNALELSNYTDSDPVYYNSNYLNCIISLHANEYERYIDNIYYNTAKSNKYIRYYIINNQNIYEIIIEVPLIIIKNKKKLILIDRSEEKVKEKEKKDCSIKTELLKSISKKLFNIIDKYLKNTTFKDEIIEQLPFDSEPQPKVTPRAPSALQVPSAPSAPQVPSAPSAPSAPVLPLNEEKQAKGGVQPKIAPEKSPEVKSSLQEPKVIQVKPIAQQEVPTTQRVTLLLPAPPQVPPQVPHQGPPQVPPRVPPQVPPRVPPQVPPQVPPRVPPQVPPPQTGPSVQPVIPEGYIKFCATNVLKRVNIKNESILKEENVDDYKRNGVVIVLPYVYDEIKNEIYKKFELTDEKLNTDNGKAIFKEYKKSFIIYVDHIISPELRNIEGTSDNVQANSKIITDYFIEKYTKILKEFIMNKRINNTIKELRIPIIYSKENTGTYYDFNSIVLYSVTAIYEILQSLDYNDITILTKQNVQINMYFSSETKENDAKDIEMFNKQKQFYIEKYKDECKLKHQENKTIKNK
jgi:hypothetical protein